MQRRATATFAVPLTGGQYAPEVVYLTRDGLAPTDFNKLGPQTLLMIHATFVASASIEVDVYQEDGTWNNYQDITSGLSTKVDLGGLQARIRVQSGGSSGTQTITYSAY